MNNGNVQRTASMPQKYRDTIKDILDFRLNSVYDHCLVNFVEPADVLIQPETVADIPQPRKDTKHAKKRNHFTLRAAYSPRPRTSHPKECVPQEIAGLMKKNHTCDMVTHTVKIGGEEKRHYYNLKT